MADRRNWRPKVVPSYWSSVMRCEACADSGITIKQVGKHQTEAYFYCDCEVGLKLEESDAERRIEELAREQQEVTPSQERT